MNNLKNYKTLSIRLRHSNFFITINPNQRFTDENDEKFKEFKKKFENVINNIFTWKNLLNNYLIIKDDNFNEERDIRSYKIVYSIELGAQCNCLHAHLIIAIDHYTKLQLDFNQIRETFIKELNLSNIHLYTRIFTDVFKSIQDYINKTKNSLEKIDKSLTGDYYSETKTIEEKEPKEKKKEEIKEEIKEAKQEIKEELKEAKEEKKEEIKQEIKPIEKPTRKVYNSQVIRLEPEKIKKRINKKKPNRKRIIKKNVNVPKEKEKEIIKENPKRQVKELIKEPIKELIKEPIKENKKSCGFFEICD